MPLILEPQARGCSQQAESMLGMAFGQSIAPVVEELYDTKEEKAEALSRHITLFNTEAQVGSICNGIICGMEEANANGKCTPEVISSVKVALIGPTSAIGDSLWVATILPILLTICLSISQGVEASMAWTGALLYLLAYPVLTCILSRKLFYFGYRSGLEGMSSFMATGKMDMLTNSMNFLGLLVVGALTASFDELVPLVVREGKEGILEVPELTALRKVINTEKAEFSCNGNSAFSFTGTFVGSPTRSPPPTL